MPVGSHKDAFKAHQLVKRLTSAQSKHELARMAADILLDFVKNQRQICAGAPPESLPANDESYEIDKLDAALLAVDSLCGKCEESHDNACFVNQARRALIAAKTNVDLGSDFDGRKSLQELLETATRKAKEREAAKPVEPPAPPAKAAPSAVVQKLDAEASSEKSLGAELEALKEKEVFRATLTDEIVSTIKAVSDGDFAAEMPIHEDEQLGKLASAFNMMLKTVKGTLSNLDALVYERSKELRLIMDNVPSGMLSIDGDGRINSERSKSADAILGVGELPGRDFLDVVGLTKRRASERAQLEEFFDLMRKELLPDEDMAGLNPFPELELPSRDGKEPVWVKLGYHLMQRGAGSSAKILVTIEDITKQKQMALEAEKAHNENSHLKAIAEDPELFREFLAEMKKSIAESEEALAMIEGGSGGRENVNKVYRGVHTVKGVAASLGLKNVVELTGGLEERLSVLREGGEIGEAFKEEVKETLARMSKERENMVESVRRLLGAEEAEGSEIHLKIGLSSIKRDEAELKTMSLPAKEAKRIAEIFASLRAVPAKLAFSRVAKMAPGLIQRLGKDAKFVFEGAETPVDCEMARPINAALLHLIRNSVDHGLESPEDREKSGKELQGAVALSVSREPGLLLVKVSDDGRGIDPLAIKAAAINKGILRADEAAALSDEAAVNLIFRPGFSTAAAITDVSGRGVGMDAVLANVREVLKGTLKVESEPGKGSVATMAIPLPEL